MYYIILKFLLLIIGIGVYLYIPLLDVIGMWLLNAEV